MLSLFRAPKSHVTTKSDIIEETFSKGVLLTQNYAR